jgi:hypothetical protein
VLLRGVFLATRHDTQATRGDDSDCRGAGSVRTARQRDVRLRSSTPPARCMEHPPGSGGPGNGILLATHAVTVRNRLVTIS